MGSSEARWWNAECVNTYKVSTLVYHRLHSKLYSRNYLGTYVKFKLGTTHFTHNYMETSHVTSNIKLFPLKLGAGLNPRPTDNMSAALPSELSELLFPRADPIPATIPISFSRLDAIEVLTYY